MQIASKTTTTTFDLTLTEEELKLIREGLVTAIRGCKPDDHLTAAYLHEVLDQIDGILGGTIVPFDAGAAFA
ncbi:MAG TPA: hypothetical protein VNW47_09440 [Terriglobales bacterium]|jgi:hypothetical protein|nr:hypothetical protein [Terriglobales bacterium]